MEGKIAVISHSQVQAELADALSKRGKSCELVSFKNDVSVKERLKEYSTIIFPFPSKKENLPFINSMGDMKDLYDKNQLVVGGLLSDEIKNSLNKNGVKFYDYFEYEPYVLKNAYITSQAAVRLLLENTKDFIVSDKVLITGFGRIGKSLAMMLRGLGMKVFISARSDVALSEAASMGFDFFRLSQLKGTVFYYDYIFNTVPHIIFDENDIRHMRDSTVYFELASAPYGADREHFEIYGKKHIQASALPGKYYPCAVAENIADFVLSKGR